MKKALVTGGAGFVGSALCRHLVGECGVRTLNVDALTYAGVSESLKKIEGHPLYAFERASVVDGANVRATLAAFRPDVVFHLAAETHVDRSIDAPTPFVETNVLGTFALLEAARAHWSELPEPERAAFRLVHVSTDEVYGALDDAGRFSETAPYAPRSPYSASKAASDHLVRAWHRTYGLPALILNASNNYGPYQFPEKLIPLVILNALEEKPLPLYGTGTQVRDWLYVEDHVRALILAARKGLPGETYNVGSRNERTNLSVVETICDVLDELRPRPSGEPHAALIAFVPDRPGHDRRYAIDASKIARELGWKARESFEAGIRKTVRWYLENDWWWRPLRERRYAGERLGGGKKA